MVRCGACRTQFNVGGPGRYACPACGSVNVVRGAPGADPGQPGSGGLAPPPPPPRVDPPSPRVRCPVCDFSFIVGDIATATCPNCGSEVATGQEQAAQ